jgi:sigma-E factor negative regulatory protein RseA
LQSSAEANWQCNVQASAEYSGDVEMNEKISTLMDGELERDEALQAIRHLGNDAARRATWDEYHLIGDVLRGESAGEVVRRKKLADDIFARLADEPIILVPAAVKVQPVQKKTRFALAMAASVVTVSAIAVVALKQQSGGMAVPVQTVQQIAPQSVLVGTVQGGQSDVRVNDYLTIHRQFANSGGFQSAAVRAERAERAERAAASK